MIRSPGDFESKIIVKVENMKRSCDGDSPPMSRKKRYSSINRYDVSPDKRGSLKRTLRQPRSPPSPRPPRYSELDEFGRSKDLKRSHSTYKLLCVRALHPKASDKQIKETLYEKYRKFGKFSVRISHEPDETIAYVYFKNSEDARDAKKCKISFFDKTALVAPVYESRNSRDYFESRSRQPQSQSFFSDHDRYYHRSSISLEQNGAHPTNRFDEQLPNGKLPMLPPGDFKKMGLPPIHSRELMIPKMPLFNNFASIHYHLRPIYPLYRPPQHFISPFRPHPHRRDKKDNFPNYMNHIQPEDDPLATRTLFVGNLEVSISDETLLSIFGIYGVVEDISVKRPVPGTGNPYAFVRYQNLDMAFRAKVEVSGKYFNKYLCKIGYAKFVPTRRIWVGGLGSWISRDQLFDKFHRFGVIQKIEYLKGDTSGYIQFESIEAATAAVKEMRGVALGGPERKLKTDFADLDVCNSPSLPSSSNSKSFHGVEATAKDLREFTGQGEVLFGWPDDKYSSYSSRSYPKNSKYVDKNEEFGKNENYHSFKQHSVSDISSPRSPLYQQIDCDVEPKERAIQSTELLSSIHTLNDLTCMSTDIWQGNLVFKSYQFLTKFYLTFGDSNIIKPMIKDEDGKFTLLITQRLRLDESKLKNVSTCIATADKHAIFLAMPDSTSSIATEDEFVPIRPFDDLVNYFKQKNAAGVILMDKDPGPTKVLYAFPPCDYSAKLLKKHAKNLSNESLENNHFVVVVVSGVK